MSEGGGWGQWLRQDTWRLSRRQHPRRTTWQCEGLTRCSLPCGVTGTGGGHPARDRELRAAEPRRKASQARPPKPPACLPGPTQAPRGSRPLPFLQLCWPQLSPTWTWAPPCFTLAEAPITQNKAEPTSPACPHRAPGLSSPGLGTEGLTLQSSRDLESAGLKLTPVQVPLCDPHSPRFPHA